MYLKKTWTYANRIEVRKYHTPKYGIKGEKRRKRKKPTPEEMKEVNERNARKKLKRLMMNNFSSGDWHLTLTYKPQDRPTPEESRKLLKKFFEKLRKSYREQGTELKYIMVTEWEGKSIHHHLAINNVPDMAALLSELWRHGGIHLTPLYPDFEYEGLADYFVKETSETFKREDNPYRQRWTCSRNLKKPVETTEVIKANGWRKEPEITKEFAKEGYHLDKNSVKRGVDSFGYPFLEYVFIRRANGRYGTLVKTENYKKKR